MHAFFRMSELILVYHSSMLRAWHHAVPAAQTHYVRDFPQRFSNHNLFCENRVHHVKFKPVFFFRMLYTLIIYCTPFVKNVKSFASLSRITFGSSFLGATEVAVRISLSLEPFSHCPASCCCPIVRRPHISYSLLWRNFRQRGATRQLLLVA